MFCENCGGKIEVGTKFCVLCGAPVKTTEESPKVEAKVEPQETVEQVQERENTSELSQEKGTNDLVMAFDEPVKPNSKNKVIIAVAGALCAIAVVAGIFILGGSPEKKINQAIKSGNVKEAYDIYKERLADESISAETADALLKATKDIYKDYANNKISQSEAYEKLLPVYDFAYSTEGANGQSEEAKRVQKKLDYYTLMLNIQGEIAEQDPLQAIQYYNQALKMDETAEEAKQELAKAEESYRALILKNVSSYESSGDLDGAEKALTEALNVLPEDAVLTNSLKTIEDKKNEIIEQQKAFEEMLDNGWDYRQNSLICYGYDDVMPSDFFAEDALIPSMEFMSETEGVLSLMLPEIDMDYRASFTYFVSDNKITLRPNPNGIFPVTDFNGVNFIYFEILSNGDLKLLDYAPDETADLGFTSHNEIFAQQEPDSVPLPYPHANMSTLYSTDSSDLLSLTSSNGYASELQLNTQNRLFNISKFVIKDGWIYGHSFANDGSGQFGKSRLDESERTVFKSNIFASYIYLVDDYIYYMQKGDEYGIYRINIHDGHLQLVKKAYGQMQIIDNNIYYTDTHAESHFYRCDLDGGNVVEILAKEVYFPSVFNDGILYQDDKDNETLHFCDLNGANDRRITYGKAYSPIYDGVHIYYQLSDGENINIWRCNPDGSNAERISSCSSPREMALTSEYIYFVNADDSCRLYRMKKDGSNLTRITDESNVAYVEIHGNQISYFECSEDWEYIHGIYFSDFDGNNKWKFAPHF